ncbi:hypothetical protein EAI77_05970 [Ligilactobacillus ruminis]|nr:hypothetical protein [Ligilactobacillus ruminis]RYS79420.1 hypothetical protein EAI77_05970 [Ligilactobacillus ruminis]
MSCLERTLDLIVFFHLKFLPCKIQRRSSAQKARPSKWRTRLSVSVLKYVLSNISIALRCIFYSDSLQFFQLKPSIACIKTWHASANLPFVRLQRCFISSAGLLMIFATSSSTVTMIQSEKYNCKARNCIKKPRASPELKTRFILRNGDSSEFYQ